MASRPHVPVLTARQLERRADALLDACLAAGHPIGPPVPVDWIAEHLLDLCILWDALSSDPERPVLGGLDPIRGEIILNERETRRFAAFPGLEVFTLAHEIGHWELHVPRQRRRQPALPGLERAWLRPCADGGSAADAHREQQADRFAALLLMPARLLMPRCERLDLTRFPARYRLRDEFGVSITAMNLRLKALGFGSFDDNDVFVPGRRKTGAQAKPAAARPPLRVASGARSPYQRVVPSVS